MSTNTTNYNLVKPGLNETADIEVINQNMDVIDTGLKNVSDKADGKISKSLATAANQFLLSSAVGQFIVKTVDEIKSLLGLKGAAEKDFNTAGGVASYDAVQSHLSDYVRQPGYAVTTGSANTYAVTLSPAPTSYIDGMGIVVKINVANTGAATINVNGLGAKPMVDGKGSALTEGKLRLNGTYSLKYNSTSGNFILQGEGGEIPKLPNLIKNGGFEKGVNCWYFFNASGSVATNIMTFTASAQYGRVVQNISKPATNDKIYMCCELKGALTSRFIMYYTASLAFVISPTIANTWQTLSNIFTYPSTGVMSTFGVDDTAANGWISIQVKNVMFFNLTQMFGPGNEPTKEEVDAMVQKYGGWWDSDLPLLINDADAVSGDILLNKVAYTNGLRLAGSMANKSFSATGGAYTPASSWKADGGGALCIRPQEGYYKNEVNVNGFGPIIANDPNFIPANIVNGKSIFGLAGNYDGRQLVILSNVWTSNSKITFVTESGEFRDANYIQVSGLTTKPVIIIISYGTNWAGTMGVYNSFALPDSGGYQTINTYGWNYRVTGQCYINSTGFRLPLELPSTYNAMVTIIY